MENSKRQKPARPKISCEYTKDKFGFYSECGYRAAYNKHWHYCPYCGKPITKLFHIGSEFNGY